MNDLAARVADLNQQILAYGGASGSAPDLADQRDLIVDQLSSIVGVRVLAREDGTIGVIAGDTMLVDGANAQTLSVRALGGGGYGVFTAGGIVVDPKSGSLKALTDLTTITLPGIQRRLDQLAEALVTTVNAIHRAGTTGTGATGVDFFDPAGITAQSISLSAAVEASGDAIAAGTGASGDGSVARQIAGLATAANAALGGGASGASTPTSPGRWGRASAPPGRRRTRTGPLRTRPTRCAPASAASPWTRRWSRSSRSSRPTRPPRASSTSPTS